MQLMIGCLDRRKKRELRDLTIAIRYSQDQGGKELEKFLNKLEKED